MANLFARKNKAGEIISYRATARLGLGDNGKPIERSTTFKVDLNSKKSADRIRREIQKMADAWERDVKEGRISASPEKFGSYIDYVLETRAARGIWKRSTIATYAKTAAVIKNAIGEVRLRDVTARKLNVFYTDLLTGKTLGHPISTKTVKARYHALIATVLEQATREGLVVRNESKLAEPPKVQQAEKKTLELEQLKKLYTVMKQEPLANQAAIRLLAETGARRGEILGLKWNNVDLENRTITIDSILMADKSTGRLYVDTPKTKKSVRVIGLTGDMVSFLRRYKAEQAKERLMIGAPDQGWVISKPDGEPINPEHFTQYCLKHLTNATGFHITPHMLRHTQASVLIANHVPITAVSQRLGHSNVSTTADIYSHALMEADTQCTETVQRIFAF